jgi:hypothetical protein
MYIKFGFGHGSFDLLRRIPTGWARIPFRLYEHARPQASPLSIAAPQESLRSEIIILKLLIAMLT